MPRFSRVREAKRRSAVLQPSVRQLFAGLLLVAGGLGCHPSVQTANLPALSALPQMGSAGASSASAAIWQLMPEHLIPGSFEEQKDGRRLFLIRGLRLVERPDGSFSRAEQLLEGDNIRFVEVPIRLGGGYWFYAVSGSQTDIWHASDWTNSLRGVAQLDFSVDELIPGFRGAYATSTRSTRIQWIPSQGAGASSATALPRAAAFDSLAFGDGGRAVVLASVRGLLETTDYGVSWVAVTLPGSPVEVQLSSRGEPQSKTTAGLWEMSKDGDFFRTSPGGVDRLFQPVQVAGSSGRVAELSQRPSSRIAARRGPLGERPLRAALLHGISDAPDTAWVVVGRNFGKVRLSDGAVLSSARYGGALPCRGLPLGEGIGFVCGSGRSATEIYRVEESQLQLEVRFAQSRVVRGVGNGAMLVEGSCPGSAVRTKPYWSDAKRGAASSRSCLLHFSRPPWEMVRSNRRAMERLTVLANGRVLLLELPRGQREGRLTLWSRDGSAKHSQPMTLSGSSAATLLARTGAWSPELREVTPGTVGAWVMGGQNFAGLTVALSGESEVHAISEAVSDSMFHESRVLQIVGAATARESHDYGASWRSTMLPPSVLTQVSSSLAAKVRGCSALGCVYDDWGRVGWGVPKAVQKPTKPKPLRQPLNYSFWSLTCHPAPGELPQAGPLVSPEVGTSRLVSTLSRQIGLESSAPASSSWLPLMGQPGPARPKGGRAYDFGQVDRAGGFRAYAWGAASGSWRRSGRWLVSVQDRFGALPPWRTASSRSPWRDAEHAAAPFGLNYGVTADWKLEITASGRTGMLRVKERNYTFHFLVEKNRAARALPIGAQELLGTVQGVVKIGEQWFLAAVDAEYVSVYRVMSNSLQVLGRYPRVARFPVKLVGNKEGTGIALWQKTARSGWFIYPLDVTSGLVEKPLTIARAQLGRTPALCSAEQKGWSVTSSVPLTDPGLSESNTHISFLGGAESLTTHALAARLVLSKEGVCAESIAALGQNVPIEGQAFKRGLLSSAALPLTVTEPLSERRWAFRCKP